MKCVWPSTSRGPEVCLLSVWIFVCRTPSVVAFLQAGEELHVPGACRVWKESPQQPLSWYVPAELQHLRSFSAWWHINCSVKGAWAQQKGAESWLLSLASPALHASAPFSKGAGEAGESCHSCSIKWAEVLPWFYAISWRALNARLGLDLVFLMRHSYLPQQPLEKRSKRAKRFLSLGSQCSVFTLNQKWSSTKLDLMSSAKSFVFYSLFPTSGLANKVSLPPAYLPCL